jgi:uncharacterized protein
MPDSPARYYVVDTDSHFQEPIDWLCDVDSELAEMLSPSVLFDQSAYDVFVNLVGPVTRERMDSAPLRMPGPIAVALRETRHLGSLREAAKAFADGLMRDLPMPFGAYDASERLQCLDQQGIDRQLVNPIGSLMLIDRLMTVYGRSYFTRAASAYNTWAAERLVNHGSRLLPTCVISLEHPDWAVAELERMRALGSRAFLVRGEAEGRAPSHPDAEPVWAKAEELGMVAVLHFGWGRASLPQPWYDTGSDALEDVAFLAGSLQPVIPQIFLTSLIAGGVLARHPGLNILVEEYFPSKWVGTWLWQLDCVPKIPQFRVLTGPWRYPLSPREYAERQVFFGCQPGDQLADAMNALGPDWFVFGSDFPHPEGSAEAVDYFRGQLEGKVPDKTISAFFGETMRRILS